MYLSQCSQPSLRVGELSARGRRELEGMSEVPVDRRFLGWERPILHSVAEQLLDAADDGGPLDLSRMLVVFPGARAGRA